MPKQTDTALARLRPMAGHYQIVRLAPDAPLPPGLMDGAGFVSVTRTGTETSIVCAAGFVFDAKNISTDWIGFVADGPLDFGAVGILARFSDALAGAGVSLFALSTFDTDYLFVQYTQAAAARVALAPFLV